MTDELLKRRTAIKRGADALNQAAKSLRGWVARSWRWRDRFEAAERRVEELEAERDRLREFARQLGFHTPADCLARKSSGYPGCEACCDALEGRDAGEEK